MTTRATSPALPAVEFPALGTTARVVVTDPSVLDAARAAVEAEVAAMDAAASRFRDDSELMAVNRAGGRPVTVSDLLLDALELARRAAELTGGLLDPTIGTALRLLGYDRDFAAIPAERPPVVRFQRAPGWQVLEIDRRRRTVRVPAGVELDLGATAKALCADRAAAAALAAMPDGTGVLVSLGGDIAVAGAAPGDGWPVLVADSHAAPLDGPGASIVIESGGLATSSVSVRRWIRGGQAIHHIVDPMTGEPAAGSWRTVSVAAASCADANIASTAAVLLGAGAPAWLADRGLPARLVAEDGRVAIVAGWPAEVGD